MEIHRHPDLHHKPKKWKDYFLEFLMIFLAVTVSFIAENIRENITDREKEKEYMKSLVKDIEDDINAIKGQQKIFESRVVLLDSLVSMLNAASIPANTKDFYYYGRLATRNIVFTSNTRTIDQMRYTGGFRFVKNDQVVTNIMSYYSVLSQIKSLEDTELGEENEYRKIAVRVFDALVFNRINSTIMVTRPDDDPPLRTRSKELLGDLAGWVHYIKNTRIGVYDYKNVVLEKGKKLIELIQKKYHLEN